MATNKYQGFPTYRYNQIALKGSNKKGESVGNTENPITEEGPPPGSPEGRESVDSIDGSRTMSSKDSVIGVDLANEGPTDSTHEVEFEDEVSVIQATKEVGESEIEEK